LYVCIIIINIHILSCELVKNFSNEFVPNYLEYGHEFL
jgi:hypothetical protein